MTVMVSSDDQPCRSRAIACERLVEDVYVRFACGRSYERLFLIRIIVVGRPSPLWAVPYPRLGSGLYRERRSCGLGMREFLLSLLLGTM